MRFIEMSDYNRSARFYWWLSTILGASALSCAVVGVWRLGGTGMLEAAVLMALVYLAGLYPIRIPGTKSSITPSDVFIFLTVLFLGASANGIMA